MINSFSSSKASFGSSYGAINSSTSDMMDFSPTRSMSFKRIWFNSSLSITGSSPLRDSINRSLSPLSMTTMISLWVSCVISKCLKSPLMIPKWFMLTSAVVIPSDWIASEHNAITSASPCGVFAPISSHPNCQNCLNLPF